MSNLGMEFNASENQIDLIPAGKYPMMVVFSEVKDTSTGGKQVVLEIDITGDQYKGRKIWKRINIINANETAQAIGRGELAALCKALGKETIKDTNELHNKRFIGEVSIRPGKGDYPDSNDIKKFLPFAISAPSVKADSGLSSKLDDEIPF